MTVPVTAPEAVRISPQDITTAWGTPGAWFCPSSDFSGSCPPLAQARPAAEPARPTGYLVLFFFVCNSAACVPPKF